MFFPRPYKIFRFYVKGVGDAVDVVKVADDLGGVMDGAVIQAVGAQGLDVGIAHLGGGGGELFCIGTKRLIDR